VVSVNQNDDGRARVPHGIFSGSSHGSLDRLSCAGLYFEIWGLSMKRKNRIVERDQRLVRFRWIASPRERTSRSMKACPPLYSLAAEGKAPNADASLRNGGDDTLSSSIQYSVMML
jgi:hypothetical protein